MTASHYSGAFFFRNAIAMQHSRRVTEDIRRHPDYRRIIGGLLGALLLNASELCAATAVATAAQSPDEAIAAFAESGPMLPVAEGLFLMGTVRTGHDSFSLTLQYDDTEQPQRRIWLDRYEIDRDEVSLSEYLRWLTQQQRPIPVEIRMLIEHVTTVHALRPDIVARWPALYVTWAEASDFCRAQGKRLPTEAEWEKAARGERANLFPWGQRPPTPALAIFGQSHAHEIPLVAPVTGGEEGRSPYGLHHMAGNAAEWVADWFGIDYYMTMPGRNPPGPATGRYKVVRGGSWKSTPALLRTATRSGAPPDRRASTIGFRCARSVTSSALPTP